MSGEPLLDWQVELMPYYEAVFIYGFGICESCSVEVAFESKHPKFSDGWWFDEARAMKQHGWVVPKLQTVYCGTCSIEQGVKHNPNAYELKFL